MCSSHALVGARNPPLAVACTIRREDEAELTDSASEFWVEKLARIKDEVQG